MANLFQCCSEWLHHLFVKCRTLSVRKKSKINYLMAISASLVLLGCNGDDDEDNESQPTPAVALDISLSASTASVGRAVQFTALPKSDPNAAAVTSYRWSFSDGQTATGEVATASFSTTGIVQATLYAILSDGSQVETSALVFVFGNSPQTSSKVDLNRDGLVNSLDALLAAQIANGVTELKPDLFDSLDINLDGKFSENDESILARTILEDAAFPSALLTEENAVYPGTVFTIMSPALLDADALVDIKVGGISAAPPVRAELGFATAIVPATLVGSGAEVPVELFANGNLVRTFKVNLKPPISYPADARADIEAAFNQAKETLTEQINALDAQADIAGVTPDEKLAVSASARAGLATLNAATSDLLKLLEGPSGPALASAFQKALYANGLAELRETIAERKSIERARPLAVATQDQVCDIVVPGICLLKQTVETGDKWAARFSAACSVVGGAIFVGGTIFPLDGPVIDSVSAAAFVRICVPLAASATIASYVGLAFAPLQVKLDLQASSQTPKSGDVVTLKTYAQFLGAGGICGAATGAAVGSIADQFGKRIAAQVIKGNATVKVLAEFYAKFSNKAYENLLKSIQDSVSNTLQASGITEALGKVGETVCGGANTGGAQVPARRVLKPVPSDAGILTFNGDGSASYICPPPGPVFASKVTLQAELPTCLGEVAKDSQPISCVTSEVQITMGDNGSALDDIFEVVINGESVLTSNEPVRSISKTLSLPSGRSTILMKGLAAPDGVGTYFFSVSGANVGVVRPDSDPLSGSDLVPGATKTFYIEVF